MPGILFELAEMNEVRVAPGINQFPGAGVPAGLGERRGTPENAPASGGITPGQRATVPALRTYQADFYELQGGSYRLEYQGSLGKESFYLPGAFLALLQFCLDKLEDAPLRQLARALGRLHAYYRLRRDFWDSGALIAGPVFALGYEELRPEEAEPEV